MLRSRCDATISTTSARGTSAPDEARTRSVSSCSRSALSASAYSTRIGTAYLTFSSCRWLMASPLSTVARACATVFCGDAQAVRPWRGPPATMNFSEGNSTESSTSTMSGVAWKVRARLLGDVDLAVVVGAIDLGDEGRLHGRAGRHLDDLDVAAVLPGDRLRSARAPTARSSWLLRCLCACRPGSPGCRRLGAAAQVVLAHQAVEIDRRGGAGVGLVVADLRHAREVRCRFRSSTRAVCSSGVPSGMSSTTWNSDLLSNGSIFSTTSWTPASAERADDQQRRWRRQLAAADARRLPSQERAS